ncbi:MAG: Sugar transferase involved in lipopolysaccharide synthesis [Candidatus Nomurabacteria bacterium GW2011_GWB1_37_5]|uniref:Sugar transferase involved in lipopolysaccharide synthesis n=1 Tax=Candidatus Nomurabacteria bacterium GW2011_GWB1_37_5 TaxID=1618742 RepID=A0A0G0JDU9_9BACT|nr:MAG: Sugar transferase involved in lipopolysaccharide synthesis [Candidatus Nomurabacteria bacterium GW2011_GWB1_37_5]
MVKNAEQDGAKWAVRNDHRITPLGRILRSTHLDEMPQLWNILRGDISFVGPRPERPEFTENLKKEIPHYEMRHIIKPGLTGWAQISYRYGASVADATEKLKYDLYYIKNRSLVLDLLIILKTIRMVFKNH